MGKIQCEIWKTPATEFEILTPRDGIEFDSPRAGGKYLVTGSAVAQINRINDSEKVLLTSWLVQQRLLGVDSPILSSSIIDVVTKKRPLSVQERAENLLRYIDDQSDVLGAFIKFSVIEKASVDDKVKVSDDGMQLLAWTASREISEVITLAEYCEAAGWIRRSQSVQPIPPSIKNIYRLSLTLPGYARLAKVTNIQSKSNQAFIAMWFDESMEDAYEKGIAPAVREAGYEPLRIDRKDHNNKIDDEIIAEIRRSRFLVADFTQGKTGARGGVYYEAGLAHGLNIPVIFTCREDALDDVHFDTRQYNHITWKTPEELRERLMQRISATIGDGPSKES